MVLAGIGQQEAAAFEHRKDRADGGVFGELQGRTVVGAAIPGEVDRAETAFRAGVGHTGGCDIAARHRGVGPVAAAVIPLGDAGIVSQAERRGVEPTDAIGHRRAAEVMGGATG